MEGIDFPTVPPLITTTPTTTDGAVENLPQATALLVITAITYATAFI